MEIRLLFLLCTMFMLGCSTVKIPVEAVESPVEEVQKEVITESDNFQKTKTKSQNFPDFCSGWADCDDYCHSYSSVCEDYCRDNLDIEYCNVAFGSLVASYYKKTREECSDPIIFNSAPVNLDKVEWIVPLGAMSGDHVTPVDHQYYQAQHNDLIEVTSPGPGVVTVLERMIDGQDNDWRLEIKHTCSIESIYIHIDELSDKLKAYYPKNRIGYPNVGVSEGEIIGWYDNNVDYNVVDFDIEIGLLNKESFSVAEQWKIHVQDPFIYFNDEIKKKLISLSQRSQEPYGGKIDYDVAGKLIGMWFLEGTNGYAGVNYPSPAYHQGHLAIAPNAIDSSYIMVSVGTYEGGTDGYQFGVGNVDALVEKAEWGLYNFGYELDGVEQDKWGIPKGSKGVNINQIGSVKFEIEGERLKADFGDGVRYYVR